MKTKEFIDEGILDSLKSKYQDVRASLTDPKYVAAKNARASMITSLVRTVDQNIRAGEIDTNKVPPSNDQSSAPVATTSPTTPATATQPQPTAASAPTTQTSQKRQSFSQKLASRELPSTGRPSAKVGSKRVARESSVYDKLNQLFESVLEATDEPDKMSLYDFLRQHSINMLSSGGLPRITSAELQPLEPVIRALGDYNNVWTKTAKRNALLDKWANLIQIIVQRRLNASVAEPTNDKSSNTTTQVGSQSAQSTTKTNPQEVYTQQLLKQIEQMSKDYIDDMPRVVEALMNQIKKIDASVYNRVLMQLGSKDAKFPYHDLMRESKNMKSHVNFPPSKTKSKKTMKKY